METQSEERKQNPNQTATTETTEKIREQDTADLLNPMAGYDQYTSPNFPNTDTNRHDP